MLKKSLIFRYVFVSLFVAVCAIFGINSYKNFLIHSEETLSVEHLQLAYNDAMQENKQIAELIFFNNLLHDLTIQTLYKQALQKGMRQNSKAQLHDYLKDKFYYFKSFGIKSINFYLPNNTLLLNMSNQNFKGASKRESITYVNSTNKEIQTVEVTENGASSVYIKPFFDKELNHMGAIEIEFSFDYIAQRIEKNTHNSLFFMHQNSVLEKFLFEESVHPFIAFDLNSKYKLHNSVYTELNYKPAIFEQFSNENKNVILKNMDNLKEFALHVFLDTQYQMVVFIPLFNALTNEHNTYLMAIGNASYSEISKIYHSLSYVILLAFFILLIIFMLIFNVQSFKEKHATILKEYNDLFKAIDKYVIMAQTDQSGFITYITQAFCDITGYTKKEIIGRNINIIRHPDMSKKFFENMWNSLYKEKKWEGEIKNIDKNGNSYWVKGIIFPKYDINNNLVGYTSIRVNISDTKQLKKINNLLKEDLSNKLYEIKMRDDSLADTTKIVLMGKILDSLAHQWKKPLSSISIELANLKARITANELTSNEVENIHDEIAYQIKTLSMTLNEFKTFFSNSNLHDKYNVYSAINESILLIKPECELHHITISLDSHQEIYCYGVFNELKQIIINLLKNSIEHLINNKTQEPLINITVFEEQKSVMIVYKDNTKGESKNIIEKVFSNNYEEQTLKDVGLNLYIVKLLLEKSGAQFWFENEQGSMSFYIKLVSHDRRKDQRA